MFVARGRPNFLATEGLEEQCVKNCNFSVGAWKRSRAVPQWEMKISETMLTLEKYQQRRIKG